MHVLPPMIDLGVSTRVEAVKVKLDQIKGLLFGQLWISGEKGVCLECLDQHVKRFFPSLVGFP